MNTTTIVLPSARAIRSKQVSIEDETLFLPNYITMSDLISKLCVVKDFSFIDNDTRNILLLEASNFQNFSKLQIQRNFFTFVKNSSYIFNFFQELSAEMFDINDLDKSDIYAEYEEHISILQELYTRYEQICIEKKLLDKIFLPKYYKFNEYYVKKLPHIIIHVDGYLTNFEFELLRQCSDYTKVDIVISTSEFNTKMQKKFLELGIELEDGYEYTISLNTLQILSYNKSHNTLHMNCESLSETLLQVVFIKQKIYEYIKIGIEPAKIAVILPDESFAPILRTFDDKLNFNFAMGEEFSNTKIYTKLNSTCQAIEQDSKENIHRLQRAGEDFYNELSANYYKNSTEVDLVLMLRGYCEGFENKTEVKIFQEELYSFEKILKHMQDMNVKSVLMMFLQRLAQRSIDDVRGGKITVMGVLETRNVEFESVIIVDFSDKHVPKKSDKDMFLNTKIREIAKLPTMSDRENLQKHYYKMLLSRSKHVAIAYVDSQESKQSRFLKQLHIKPSNKYHEIDYANILFANHTVGKMQEKKIVEDYSFKDTKLSATKLKTFLTCKRKFYYMYVKQIQHHEIPKDMPREYEIGNDVHNALKELYSKKNSYFSLEELRKDLHYELDTACGNSELEKYLIALQKRKMEEFCKNEVQRFEAGWHVEMCEKSFEIEFAGITLVGQIDRIDKRGNELEVLDYKTGAYPIYTAKNVSEATDFQLEFYYLLANQLGNVVACAVSGSEEVLLGCGYYDLKESKIVSEIFLKEKIDLLQSHVKDLLAIEDVDFSKCDDIKNCIYCEYKTICGRE